MPSSDPTAARILQVLARQYYQVVPQGLETYCVATSRISRIVLQHFGVACDLLPCQMWYAAPHKSLVIGFVGHPQSQAQGRWDGHVVCAGKGWFLDAAVRHWKTQFGFDVPQLVCAPRITLPSQTIGRVDLTDTERLWWMHPPAGVNAEPPVEPPGVIEPLAQRLIERLEVELGTAVPHKLAPA